VVSALRLEVSALDRRREGRRGVGSRLPDQALPPAATKGDVNKLCPVGPLTAHGLESID